MRILNVVKSITNGGSGRSIPATAKCLKDFGSYELRFLSLMPAWEEAKQRALNSGYDQVISSPDPDQLRKELMEADIVHLGFWNDPVIYDFLRSDLPPMRVLIFFHISGDFMPHIITPEIVEFPDYCVSGCPHAHNIVLEKLGKSGSQNTGMVWSTADFSRVENIKPKNHESFNVSYIGNLETKKMHPGLVSMSAEADIPNVKFILCGDGDVSPIHREIEELNATDRFDVRGYVENIKSVLEISDVFGYPLGINPGAELCLQEAMYAGIPAVVFGKGGLKDHVVHGENGLIVSSPGEYTKAIEYLYQHPEERLRMGNNAQKYARGNLGGQNTAPVLNSIYNKMMPSPKRTHILKRNLSPEETDPGSPASFFIESIGELGGEFKDSKYSKYLQKAITAEEQIAQMTTPALYGVRQYQEYYPHDPYLQLWKGLLLTNQGEFEEAVSLFSSAYDRLREPRILKYQAKSLEMLGKSSEAQVILQRYGEFGGFKQVDNPKITG